MVVDVQCEPACESIVILEGARYIEYDLTPVHFLKDLQRSADDEGSTTASHDPSGDGHVTESVDTMSDQQTESAPIDSNITQTDPVNHSDESATMATDSNSIKDETQPISNPSQPQPVSVTEATDPDRQEISTTLMQPSPNHPQTVSESSSTQDSQQPSTHKV